MLKVRALIFDDDQSELSEINFALQQAWDSFQWKNGEKLPELVITQVSDKTSNGILKILATSSLHDKFDFFLSDIYVGIVPDGVVKADEHRPEPEGFRFLKMAKEHGMPLCFGITTGRWGTHESFQKAYTEFSGHIDGNFLKSDLKGVHATNAPMIVLGKIANLLRGKGLIQSLRTDLVFDTHIQESRTQAIVEEVGEENINALVSAVAFMGANSVALSSLSPGLSGAKILKLVFEGSSEDLSTRPILLKISRDKNALQKERDNFYLNIKEPSRNLKRSVISPREDLTELIESNGWHAISFECASPAMSLVDWLTQKDSPSKSVVCELLDDLFFDGGVADTYKTTQERSEYPLDCIETSLLSKYRKMAILEAINEFKPLLDKYADKAIVGLGYLSIFLGEERLDGISTRELKKRMSTSCLVHGDFHARNVLITRRGIRENAVIIDLASMRTAIWSTDLVRLICDLFLSGWDRGSNSFEWSRLESWTSFLPLLIRSDSQTILSEPEPENQTIKIAIDWLFENKFRIASIEDEAYHQAEFSLSLGIEFARASYRDRDLTAPKRAFALIVANCLLQESSQLFKARSPRVAGR